MSSRPSASFVLFLKKERFHLFIYFPSSPPPLPPKHQHFKIRPRGVGGHKHVTHVRSTDVHPLLAWYRSFWGTVLMLVCTTAKQLALARAYRVHRKTHTQRAGSEHSPSVYHRSEHTTQQRFRIDRSFCWKFTCNSPMAHPSW